MTSVKLKFRASAVEKKEGFLYYQITHERVVRQIKTTYEIAAEEWNEYTNEIVTRRASIARTKYLLDIKNRIKLDTNRLAQIIFSLKRKDDNYTTDCVTSIFNKQLTGKSLINFMHDVILRLIQLRKYRTSETYKATLNSFMRFRGGEDLLLTDITPNLIMDYEVYLKAEGVTMNTVSFYMRVLRAVYNRAVEDDLIEQHLPFRKVYTGVGKTVKRALPLKDIKMIKSLDLTCKQDLIFARDMFLFSFYTRGMSFVDMAYLRRRDLQNGTLTYCRRKTGQRLHIKWESCMQEILDRYPITDSDYLLPIITNRRKDDRAQYLSRLGALNIKLKKIGAMINSEAPLTLYVARHSWASVAKSRNIPISVISEGMGHDSEMTTQIYLSSLDTSVIDRANNSILKLL